VKASLRALYLLLPLSTKTLKNTKKKKKKKKKRGQAITVGGWENV
jgi:hypothetical protein